MVHADLYRLKDPSLLLGQLEAALEGARLGLVEWGSPTSSGRATSLGFRRKGRPAGPSYGRSAPARRRASSKASRPARPAKRATTFPSRSTTKVQGWPRTLNRAATSWGRSRSEARRG